MRTRRKHSRGFTLVELSLSLAVMVTLCAIAMPRYARAIAAYRARCAAQRVVEDLAQAQSYARTSSTSRTISFDVTTATYQIANLKALDSSSTTYRVSLGHEPYKASISTIDFGGATQIVFDGYGYPNCGGTITLVSGDTTKKVVVDAATGKASVQ